MVCCGNVGFGRNGEASQGIVRCVKFWLAKVSCGRQVEVRFVEFRFRKVWRGMMRSGRQGRRGKSGLCEVMLGQVRQVKDWQEWLGNEWSVLARNGLAVLASYV